MRPQGLREAVGCLEGGMLPFCLQKTLDFLLEVECERDNLGRSLAYSIMWSWGMNNASPDLFSHCTWTSRMVLERSWAASVPGSEEGKLWGQETPPASVIEK